MNDFFWNPLKIAPARAGMTMVEILLAVAVLGIIVALSAKEMERLRSLQKIIELFVDRQEIRYVLDNSTDCELTIAQCSNPSTDVGKRVKVFRSSGNILIDAVDTNYLTWRLRAECNYSTPNVQSIRVYGVPNIKIKEMPNGFTFDRDIKQVSYSFCQSGSKLQPDPDDSTITQISPYTMSANSILPNTHDCFQFGNPVYPALNYKVHDQDGNEILPTPPDTRLAHRSGTGIATCPPDTLLVGGGGLFVYWNETGYLNGGGPSGFLPYRNPSTGIFSYRAQVCATVNSNYAVNLAKSNVTAICNPRTNGGRYK